MPYPTPLPCPLTRYSHPNPNNNPTHPLQNNNPSRPTRAPLTRSLQEGDPKEENLTLMKVNHFNKLVSVLQPLPSLLSRVCVLKPLSTHPSPSSLSQVREGKVIATGSETTEEKCIIANKHASSAYFDQLVSALNPHLSPSRIETELGTIHHMSAPPSSLSPTLSSTLSVEGWSTRSAR